jgi:hypothetical protein
VEASPVTVRRRCVFYVSGFDPKGAGHYHALYKEQAALQEKAGGLHIDVGPRRRMPNGNAFWDLRTHDAGVDVDTHYEFMRWDDVVRAFWPRTQLALWREIFVTTAFYLRHGALQKIWRLSWPPALALTVPPVLLVATLLLLLAGSGTASWLGLRLTGSPWVALGAAAAACAGIVLAARRLEARWSMYWIMRSYAFTRRQALGLTPDLEQRLDDQAAVLAERLRADEDDEVLVVAHSSGAFMAVSIVARALKLLGADRQRQKAALSLMTLGQWIPMLAALPQAVRFREEMAYLASAEGLDWIDFSAPPDGCCFALCDPVSGCDAEPARRLDNRPKLLSPRFAEMFEPAAYQALRKDKFEMHFQYLKAGQRKVAYDYFGITAGQLNMARRFAGVPGVQNYRVRSQSLRQRTPTMQKNIDS